MRWFIWFAALAVLAVLVLFWPIGSGAQVPTATLSWTAPGDDGNVGTATAYQMRWSSTKPDTTTQTLLDTWWSAATPVGGLPAPLVAGTVQSMVVLGPFGIGTYYFVMRAADEVPNWSPYSNVAVFAVADTAAPRRVIDLIAR